VHPVRVSGFGQMGGSCYGWTRCSAESMPCLRIPCGTGLSIVFRGGGSGKVSARGRQIFSGSRAATNMCSCTSRELKRSVMETGTHRSHTHMPIN
jgi:hypothetical protein